MILAAGLATRMRPLTNDTAKPLLTLGGRALLDHAWIIWPPRACKPSRSNAFWQAEKVVAHLVRHAPPPETIVARETECSTRAAACARAAASWSGPVFRGERRRLLLNARPPRCAAWPRDDRRNRCRAAAAPDV